MLETTLTVFSLAVFLALVNERLIEYFVAPLFDKYGYADYLPYASLITGGLISLGFGPDLFGPLVQEWGFPLSIPWSGYVLTAFVVGGGSNLLHDLWGLIEARRGR